MIKDVKLVELRHESASYCGASDAFAKLLRGRLESAVESRGGAAELCG